MAIQKVRKTSVNKFVSLEEQSKVKKKEMKRKKSTIDGKVAHTKLVNWHPYHSFYLLTPQQDF